MKSKKFKKSSSQSQNNVFESSDLNTAVATTAVAQICQSVGYSGAQTSALQILTDVAVRYLQSLAKSAATSASSTGRTECNLLDIIRAFEDLHSDIGFNGNSEPKRRLCVLSNSSILHDMMKFVNWTREIPFAKPLPRRCRTVKSCPPCFSDEDAKWNHIPRWLPAFPKISEGGETTVVPPATESEIEFEKKIPTNREISRLPNKRKKVSFKIGGGGKNEIEIGIDLRTGVCKGGKRISCLIYDDESFIHANSRSNHDMMKKFEEPSSRTKMIMMFKQIGQIEDAS